jgi:putative DNA primase/helicase
VKAREFLEWRRHQGRPIPPELEAIGEPDQIELCSDLGNARRFARDHIGKLLYLKDRQLWMRWDGLRWERAARTDLQAAAKKTARKMLGEAAQKTVDLEKASKWAIRSMSARSIGSMVDLAASEASEPEFNARSADFDTHPHLLVAENGTVDLEHGYLVGHEPDERLTKLTPIEYDQTAECPRWEQFLREVFADDLDLIAFVQRAVGYSLTGETREHAFFVLHGGGKNGKGRFIRQLIALLGDAAKTTAFSTFTAGRFSDAERNTPALAALAGARLVVAGEPDEGVRFSESIIKSLTGEDEIQACAKYEAPFSFTPRFKIWLHCNHRPEIRGTDEGIWRRPKLIPFNVSFEGREDLRLDEKLDEERPGILAWAVRGATAWYEHGLGTCAAVKGATAGYRQESDPIAPFVEDCLELKKDGFETNGRICAAYQTWCMQNGIEPLKAHALSKRLAARGLSAVKVAGVRGLRGAVLKRVAVQPSSKPSTEKTN